jgi:hypothetical protein
LAKIVINDPLVILTLPKDKDKKKGRNILVETKQGIRKPQLVNNQKILLSKSELFFDSKINYDSYRTSNNCSSG